MQNLPLSSLTILQAADVIKDGGLVAVPTETVYGLAANALDEAAVRRIYDIKGRPAKMPLSILISDVSDNSEDPPMISAVSDNTNNPGSPARGWETEISKYCEDVPPAAIALAKRFWPGPLTIILRAKNNIPPIVRAGGETIALRCPDHPMTLELLAETMLPLACPSANPTGKPSPRTAAEVAEYFSLPGGFAFGDTSDNSNKLPAIDGVIDGGDCQLGTESTILDLSAAPYRIIRRGALSESEIFAALMENLKIIGITGGSGAGKSTAMRVLAGMGAYLCDCDALYHELLDTGTDMLDEIAKIFPTCFSGGRLNRKALGGLVFSDKAALNTLNTITHKHVIREVKLRLSRFALSGGEYGAIEAIALIECGLAEICASVVGIIAPREDRISRIVRREGITPSYAALRIAAQKSDAYFHDTCDYILENSGAEREFEEKCRQLFSLLLRP